MDGYPQRDRPDVPVELGARPPLGTTVAGCLVSRSRRAAVAALLAVAACSSWPASAEAKAPRPHVVLIVFDEVPHRLARGPGRADRCDPVPRASPRWPGTSIWFRNHHAVADTTSASVPAILTSTRPQPATSASSSPTRNYRHSLFTLLGSLAATGSRPTDGNTRICPPQYCRYPKPFGSSPGDHPRSGSAWTSWIAFLRSSLRRSSRPRLSDPNPLLPHVPWHPLTPSGHMRDPGPLGQGRAGTRRARMASPDPFLTIQDEQRHLLQVGYVDRVIGSPDRDAQAQAPVRSLAGGDHGRPRGLLRARRDKFGGRCGETAATSKRWPRYRCSSSGRASGAAA